MHKKIILASLVAAALGTSMGAFAQDHDHDRYGDRDHSSQYGDRHDNGEHRGWDRDHRDTRSMGAYGEHRWARGDRLPDQYRHREYYVGDWRAHHLHAPPRGYQWVNVDGNYVLVALASGLIADMVINSR